MRRFCAECGEPFAPVEYRDVPVGEDEFCSDPCEDRFVERSEVSEVYWQAGWPSPAL